MTSDVGSTLRQARQALAGADIPSPPDCAVWISRLRGLAADRTIPGSLRAEATALADEFAARALETVREWFGFEAQSSSDAPHDRTAMTEYSGRRRETAR